MGKYIFSAWILALGLIAPLNVLAETVILKSGKRIEGAIIEKTDRFIKIEVNGSPVYFELKYIASIEGALSLQDAREYFKRGLKYGSEGRFREAEEAFKKGLEISPVDSNLQEALAIMDDLSKGKIQEDYTISLFKGSSLIIDERYAEAIEEFQKALEKKPDDSNLNYYLGICSYQLQKFENAIVYLSKALLEKEDSEIYYYIGASHYSLNQYPQAKNFLSRALEMNPQDADAYAILGTSNYLSGDIAQARKDLNTAKKLYEENADFAKSREIEDVLGQIND